MKRVKAKKPKVILERVIEAASDRHAKARGWTSRKMNGLGFRSWPDRLFLPPPNPTTHGRTRFWVEFKRFGEEATPDQARIHADLRARDELVHVCDSIDYFKAVFDAYHAGQESRKKRRGGER